MAQTSWEPTLEEPDVGEIWLYNVAPDDALLTGYGVVYSHCGFKSREPLYSGQTPNEKDPGQEISRYCVPSHDSTAIPLSTWLEAILPAIHKIEAFEENWDSYGSPPPSPELISEALSTLHYAEFPDLPAPAIVPVSGGGIQLEWHLPFKYLEIEFHPEGKASFLAENLVSHEIKEASFYSQDYNRVRSLIGWLLGDE